MKKPFQGSKIPEWVLENEYNTFFEAKESARRVMIKLVLHTSKEAKLELLLTELCDGTYYIPAIFDADMVKKKINRPDLGNMDSLRELDLKVINVSKYMISACRLGDKICPYIIVLNFQILKTSNNIRYSLNPPLTNICNNHQVIPWLDSIYQLVKMKDDRISSNFNLDCLEERYIDYQSIEGILEFLLTKMYQDDIKITTKPQTTTTDANNNNEQAPTDKNDTIEGEEVATNVGQEKITTSKATTDNSTIEDEEATNIEQQETGGAKVTTSRNDTIVDREIINSGQEKAASPKVVNNKEAIVEATEVIQKVETTTTPHTNSNNQTTNGVFVVDLTGSDDEEEEEDEVDVDVGMEKEDEDEEGDEEFMDATESLDNADDMEEDDFMDASDSFLDHANSTSIAKEENMDDSPLKISYTDIVQDDSTIVDSQENSASTSTNNDITKDSLTVQADIQKVATPATTDNIITDYTQDSECDSDSTYDSESEIESQQDIYTQLKRHNSLTELPISKKHKEQPTNVEEFNKWVIEEWNATPKVPDSVCYKRPENFKLSTTVAVEHPVGLYLGSSKRRAFTRLRSIKYFDGFKNL